MADFGDAPLITTFAVGVTAGQNWQGTGAMLLTDLFAYVLVSPIIHGLHEDGAGAGISMVLHIGTPLLSAVLGAGFGSLAPTSCPVQTPQTICFGDLQGAANGFVIGAGIGMGVSTLIDSLALTWRHTTHERTSSKKPSSWWALTPTANPRGGGLAVQGAF